METKWLLVNSTCISSYCFFIRNALKTVSAREMAQWLKVFAALALDLGYVPSIHIELQSQGI